MSHLSLEGTTDLFEVELDFYQVSHSHLKQRKQTSRKTIIQVKNQHNFIRQTVRSFLHSFIPKLSLPTTEKTKKSRDALKVQGRFFGQEKSND